MMDAWDNQRSAMYNAWANNKIWLEVITESDGITTTVSTTYNGNTYSKTCIHADLLFDTIRPFNVAWNQLEIAMKNIDSRIELKHI